jgi:hypothetical protein
MESAIGIGDLDQIATEAERNSSFGAGPRSAESRNPKVVLLLVSG